VQHSATRYNTVYCESARFPYDCRVCESRDTLQHTATQFTANQRDFRVTVEFVSHGTYCNTLQHTATHCNTLRHTATHCNVVHCESARFPCDCRVCESRNTLQHPATHYNTLQLTATQFTANLRDFRATVEFVSYEKRCNTLQHTATHCNTLQRRVLRIGEISV